MTYTSLILLDLDLTFFGDTIITAAVVWSLAQPAEPGIPGSYGVLIFLEAVQLYQLVKLTINNFLKEVFLFFFFTKIPELLFLFIYPN